MSPTQDWSWMTPGGYDLALNQATPDENACLRQAAGILRGAEPALQRGRQWAGAWVEALRTAPPPLLSLERLLQDYPLSSPEGVALIRLAEALVRTPDTVTRTALMADKLSQGHWDTLRSQHAGLRAWQDAAFAWAARQETAKASSPQPNWWTDLMTRGIDQAAGWMLHQISQQFIGGVSVDQTDPQLIKRLHAADRLSFDSLGESAQTADDVDHYMSLYEATIASLGNGSPHGMSVKLSALHAQFDELHRQQVMTELPGRVARLARLAARHGIPMTIDAEESDRLMLTLDVANAVHELLAQDSDADVRAWQGLGLAVQAYQKRATKVIELLLQHAADTGRRWQVRLVKGAYWDTEIMRAQTAGLKSYPVLTSRAATDMHYLACARLLMRNRSRIYPMFGSHNALTLGSVLAMAVKDPHKAYAADDWNFECQRLHGMGEALWQHIRSLPAFEHLPCRIYTPVGTPDAALSYLMRRLLENGANTSFIHQIHQAQTSVGDLLRDPLEVCSQRMFAPSEQLPDPPRLFGERRNSAGFHLANRDVQRWAVAAVSHGRELRERYRTRFEQMAVSLTEGCCEAAAAEFDSWHRLPVQHRSTLLETWADRIEIAADQAVALLVSEANKTLQDAAGEVRECIDFLRYYAQQARRLMAHPTSLQGPAGQSNQLRLTGRGVWLCISPWNFPLAIFTGQIAAALVSGNTVLAKPAEQTTAIAAWAMEQAHAAGIPASALHAVPAARQQAEHWLVHPAVCGVSFTGSTGTAREIRMRLAGRDGPQIPLIAETGGMNAMVVDSTALLEQATDHIIDSAFNMAGQRCSALRVLYVQTDIADALIKRLSGRIQLINNSAPDRLDCDVPPLIDLAASQRLQAQWQALAARGTVRVEPVFQSIQHHTDILHLCSPGLIEMPQPATDSEIFGPLLQVCRFDGKQFAAVLDDIARWGWGLTLGLQSRIDERIAQVAQLPVGNVYINRNMIGAVVGVQPFGGQGLSGSGLKAGGPDSLRPYCNEQVISINTAAAGGVMELLSLPADPIKLANRFDA